MDTVSYEYHFSFPNGREEQFHINLDGVTLAPLEPLPPVLPEWTRLEFKQCAGCQLPYGSYSHCPLAAHLSPVVEQLSDVTSIDQVKVTVVVDDRTLTRSATAQEGISSLMGVIVATSGCPVTEFFKPMARFHLPFASPEETFYRAASMYMLAQYYRWQDDLSADMDMKGLFRFYEKVAKVNKGMADRIRSIKREDGAINALVLLDMFVHGMQHGLGTTLEELKPLFAPYLAETNII
jgi:hypothetical protein